jgi:uncharacterized protein
MHSMSKQQEHKRFCFDLNHPADFHFFRHLMNYMKQQGYTIKVIARDKECLHMLLNDAGISYISRGRGKHTLAGKYFYAIWILLVLTVALIRFRPTVALSLSSPYLAVLTRILGITCVTYDDTDINPRLLPLIRQSTYLLSPITYPHNFHKGHFHLPCMKELAYLHPKKFQYKKGKSGVFLRVTRTDSVHHSSASKLDLGALDSYMDNLSREQTIYLSTEMDVGLRRNPSIKQADPLDIHRQLASCRVFWGNSATMAAEAAVLGVPAIVVSAEEFAYLKELESYGLLYYYHPENIPDSFNKLASILDGDPTESHFSKSRDSLLREKMDMTGFLIWFLENLPKSAEILGKDPEYSQRFISSF